MQEEKPKQRIIAEHIEGMKPKVTSLIDTLFAEISSPARIEVATYPQLVQAMQTLIKCFADEEEKESGKGMLRDILGDYYEGVK